MNLNQSNNLIPLKNNVRFVTATSLFDGHDAAINIMRRIMQSLGAEVIHLGHDRSVEEIVNVAIQEDVQGIAVSSYQGGHIEYFKYIIELLKENNSNDIKVFGGGGGVIRNQEIKELMDYGVEKIYSPEDGRVLGLTGIINDMLKRSDFNVLSNNFQPEIKNINPNNVGYLAKCVTWIEQNINSPNVIQDFIKKLNKRSESQS